MKTKQHGFAVLETLLIIIILGIIGGAGYYVWHSKTAASDNHKAADQVSKTELKPTTNLLSLDESKLPKGWTVGVNSATQVEVSIGDGLGDGPVTKCWVEALSTTDNAAESGDQAYAKSRLVADVKAAHDNKGYTYAAMTDATATLNTGQATKTVKAFVGKFTSPDDAANPMYQKRAYVVLSHRYVAITQSCAVPDFAQADEALSAIIIRL